MKKIFVAAAAILFLYSAKAQNLSFGPVAGFGHSWLQLSNDEGAKSKFHPSYSIGGKLVYSFVSRWGISADLKFSSEGGTLQSDEGGDEYKYTYRGNYIRLPLQGIYFFGELGDKVRPKVSLGPSFGFLVGGKSKLEVNGTKTDEADSKDAFTGFDIGLNAAAGANFRIGTNKWLNTDITYYHGFSNVFEDAGDTKVRNRGLGINIGITFPLGTVKPD